MEQQNEQIEVPKSRISPKIIVAVMVFVLLAGGVLAYIFKDANFIKGDKGTENTDIAEEEKFIAPYSLIYGSWTSDKSEIISYDLSTGIESTLAQLPYNSKKVTLISPSELLYIADLDEKDHGESLKILNITTGETETIYSAIDNYGIDDYRISPNKRYIATWEAKFSQTENILFGGTTKVTTIDLQNPQDANNIYEEQANQPVHYPIAIMDTGKIFLDTFLPNSKTGWAHGMSVSSLDGLQKEILQNMQNGTYGSQPQMNSDGSLLVFAGYDETRGSGTDIINGSRRAILTTNTLEILDTTTHERSKLDVPNSNFYRLPRWGTDNEISLTVLSRDVENTGQFSYNFAIGSLQDNELEVEQSVIHTVPEGSFVGIAHKDDSALGNLGQMYSYPYTSISFKDNSGTVSELPLASSFAQFIDIVPASSLTNSSIFSVQQEGASGRDEENLKLKTFHFKPTLAPVRLKQQSEVVVPNTPTQSGAYTCKDYAVDQCNQLFGTQYTWSDVQRFALGARSSGGKADTSNPDYQFYTCATSTRSDGISSGACFDSPLYLYGPEGLEVSVRIHTPIYEENIPNLQDPTTDYAFTLGEKGLFFSNGKSYQSLSFDYTPAIRTRPPHKGTVVKKENVEDAVKEYAQRLGLNTKETHDLVTDIKGKTTGEYVFLSFYSQEASKYLLPISFDPQPDTYINYVFYVRNLTSPQELGYTPKEPEFEKVERGTFTAVEVSVVTD